MWVSNEISPRLLCLGFFDPKVLSLSRFRICVYTGASCNFNAMFSDTRRIAEFRGFSNFASFGKFLCMIEVDDILEGF